MSEISIIIVTWNSMLFIKDCLKSILTQTYKDWELIIVDNASQDGTVDFIKENCPQAVIIENGKNEGFCKANNQGIRVAQGEYILILNSDVILEHNFLYQIKKSLGKIENNVGMAGAKILQMGKKTISSTGLIISKSRRFYDRGKGESDKKQYDAQVDIFGACAAAVLYKREMLEQIKLSNEYFDEDFFFLLEDFDLAWRAHLLGWKAVFLPEAICYHQGNSSGYHNGFRQYLSFRNRYLLMLKNDTLGELFKHFSYLIIYDSLRFVYVLFHNRYFFQALREIYTLMPKMLRKRAMITKKIKLTKT